MTLLSSHTFRQMSVYNLQTNWLLLHILLWKKGANRVVLLSVVPRSCRLAGDEDIFQDNLTLFNRYVKTLSPDEPAIVWHKLKGFFHSNTHISEWSTDGIHCDKEHNVQHYKRRMRQSLLFHKHHATHHRWVNTALLGVFLRSTSVHQWFPCRTVRGLPPQYISSSMISTPHC